MLTPDEVRAALDRLTAAGSQPPGTLDGRGIVICAGGAQIFTNAYVLVYILRRILKTALPIEVWHLGKGEMTAAMRRLLEELGAAVVDAETVLAAHPARIADGWQLKVYALMRSPFAEVLLLDADQVPVRDPADLFDWPEFASTGAVFWPDIVDLRADNPIWPLCGLPPRRTRSWESGQLLVDKRRHWLPLSIALYLNEEADTFYELVYGDKDTFLLAWALLGASHHLIPHDPVLAEFGLVQKDRNGSILFQHRTGEKWAYARTEAPRSDFAHHAECLAALAELRERWGGRLFERPPRSAAARAKEESVTGGLLRFAIAEGDEEPVRLLPDGEIGEGRTHERRYWYVVDREGELALIFTNGDRETFVLREQRPGEWAGRSLIVPAVTVFASINGVETLGRAGRRTLVDDLLDAAGFRGSVAGRIDADLRAALRLLCRTDPSAPERLHTVADASVWPADARRQLRELARELAESDATKPGERVSRGSTVLTDRYVDSFASEP